MAKTGNYKLDPNSETWRAIAQWIEGRLEMRRGNLELTGLPNDETENNRGAIEELKELENLAKPAAVLESPLTELEL